MSQQQQPTDLEARIETLEDEIESLRTRVADLEDGESTDDSPSGRVDQYDGYVIQTLEKGDIITLSKFKSIYRKSGIRSKRKIKQRIQAITKMDYFERAGTQRWRFVGRDDRREKEETTGGER